MEDSRLDRFLASRVTHHAVNYTHQSIYNKKKYLIEDHDMDVFWGMYCDHILTKGFISLCERPRPGGYTTLRGDVDIKIPESVADQYTMGHPHLYTKDEVVRLIELYHSIIHRHVKNVQAHQLYCFILEKSGPSSADGYKKSGFHIEFPFLLCSRDEQRAFIFPKLEEEFTASQLFNRFRDYPQSIFDSKAVTSNPWLLYGSRKGAGKEAYQLTCIFDGDMKEVSLELVMEKCKILNSSNQELEINAEVEVWEDYLPRILSTVDSRKKRYMNEVKSCDYSITKKDLVKLPPVDREQEKAIPTNPSESLLEAKKIMPMLSPKRATDYKSWFEIGCVLYNLGTGSIDALDTWIEFSKKTEMNNFSEATCITRWGKMKKTDYGIGTLIYYAKQDSPEVYTQFRQANSRKSIMEAIRKNGQLSSQACAEALYHKYKNEFVYTGAGKDGWYKFDHHRWTQISEGIELRKLIPTLQQPIMEEIKKIREKINEVENSRRDKEEANEDADTEAKQIKEHDKTRTTLMKEKNKLEDTPFKDKILKECKDLFLDQQFLEKVDNNMFLLGFTNGVLDLDQMEFREGRPTDYITLSTDYEFREVGEREEEMRLIDDYLQRVFPNEDLRSYFMDYMSSCLRGGNINKKVLVWSGIGDNSKSIMEDLVKKSFGQYFHVFPTPLLTGKRTQSSGASPELIKSAGTRFAVIQEPSEKEEFNIGMLKELSGNDMIYARGLFKDATKFLPQFKLVVICNKLPRVPCDDQATWNRIRVLDYESRFVNESECPPTFEEQLKKKVFPKVLGFSFTSKMIQAFMSKMFFRYRDIIRRGSVPKEPEQVTKATKMYRVKNDTFMNFINDRIKDDPESSLTITDMYGTFKEWYKMSYASYNCPSSKNEFREYFEKYYKHRFQVNRVSGIRYMTEEDDDIVIMLNQRKLEAEAETQVVV